jgi:hypothetical protein
MVDCFPCPIKPHYIYVYIHVFFKVPGLNKAEIGCKYGLCHCYTYFAHIDSVKSTFSIFFGMYTNLNIKPRLLVTQSKFWYTNLHMPAHHLSHKPASYLLGRTWFQFLKRIFTLFSDNSSSHLYWSHTFLDHFTLWGFTPSADNAIL